PCSGRIRATHSDMPQAGMDMQYLPDDTMFSFFKKKKPEAETPEAIAPAAPAAETPVEQPGFLRRLFGADPEAIPAAAPETPAAPPVEESPPARDATNIDPFAARIAEDAAILSSGYEGQLFPETAERPGSE